jgi:hypothetical protein
MGFLKDVGCLGTEPNGSLKLPLIVPAPANAVDAGGGGHGGCPPRKPTIPREHVLCLSSGRASEGSLKGAITVNVTDGASFQFPDNGRIVFCLTERLDLAAVCPSSIEV